MINLILDDNPRVYKLKPKKEELYDSEKYRGQEIDFDVNARRDLEVI